MLRTSYHHRLAFGSDDGGVSPEVGTDDHLIAGLKFQTAACGRLDSSPDRVGYGVLHNLVRFLAVGNLFVRMMPSRRPSPSASRPRTVAVLKDQEG